MTNIIVMMSVTQTHTHKYSYWCLSFPFTWQLISISADFPLVDSSICCTDVLQSAIVFPEAAKLGHHVSECESRES